MSVIECRRIDCVDCAGEIKGPSHCYNSRVLSGEKCYGQTVKTIQYNLHEFVFSGDTDKEVKE